MEQAKRWTEIESARIGLLITQAFNNLEHGEDGEVDVDRLVRRALLFTWVG